MSYYQSPKPHLKAPARDQHVIGWFAFLKGFIAQSVVDTQSEYFQDIGSQRSGTVWAAALCKQLWAIHVIHKKPILP